MSKRKPIKVVYLNVSRFEGASVVEIAPELDEYYRLIECELIDIVSRKIGKNYYDIICDDEGLYAPTVRISAVDNEFQPMLVGNLIICKSGRDGYEHGLSEAEQAEVLEHITKIRTLARPEGYKMLMDVEY